MAIFVLTFSCSEEKQQENIIVDLLKEAKDSIRYSQFVDFIEYINLETTDSCLIDRIKDMALIRDRMFIFDERQQTIWIFDRKGKYINKISRKGEGPGEYPMISQFEYDERKNQIVVLSSWKKVLTFYTPEGEYLKTVNLGMIADDFKICPGGGFILSNAGLDETSAGIYYANESGLELECLVRRKSNHLVNTTVDWELCSYGDIICFMAPNFDNTVYHFVNQKLSVEYPFIMKPDLKHDYMETVSLQYFEDFIRTSYVEGEKWMWVTYWSSVEGLRVFIYSKVTGNYWIGKIVVNDIDDQGIWRRVSIADDNTFVAWEENDDPDENPVIGILHLK